MMTREEIKNQIAALETENIEIASMAQDDDLVEMANQNTQNINLLRYAVENASDDDLRIAQLSLPGRASVLRWAEKHMEA